MSRRNYKNDVWQDNFIKHWTCSAKNHPEGWSWWKKRNRRDRRNKLKRELREENNNG